MRFHCSNCGGPPHPQPAASANKQVINPPRQGDGHVLVHTRYGGYGTGHQSSWTLLGVSFSFCVCLAVQSGTTHIKLFMMSIKNHTASTWSSSKQPFIDWCIKTVGGWFCYVPAASYLTLSRYHDICATGFAFDTLHVSSNSSFSRMSIRCPLEYPTIEMFVGGTARDKVLENHC